MAVISKRMEQVRELSPKLLEDISNLVTKDAKNASFFLTEIMKEASSLDQINITKNWLEFWTGNPAAEGTGYFLNTSKF